MSNHFSSDQSRSVKPISVQGPHFWPCVKLVGLEKSFGRLTFLRCKSFVYRKIFTVPWFSATASKNICCGSFFNVPLKIISGSHYSCLWAWSGLQTVFGTSRLEWSQEQGKYDWLHPQKCGPAEDQGPGDVIKQMTWHVLALVWNQQRLLETVTCFEFSGGCCPSDTPGRKCWSGGEVVSV